MNQYDCIVIGAGNGGLAAAATTAQKGLKTLLIEKHNLPGGCASSFKRGRFEFETALHELGRYGPKENPGNLRMLFERLGVDADIMEIDDVFRCIVPGANGYDAVMPTGRQSFINKMEEYVPGSKKSMEQYFSLVDDSTRALEYIKSTGKPDLAIMQTEHSNYMRIASQTVDTVLDSIEMPIRAQHILSSYWGYLGVPTNDLSFVPYASMTDGYIRLKAYLPRMRSHELSLAIEKRIRDFGGDVWYNTEVTRILVKDGKAYGVATKDGEIYAEHIIANVIPHNVFGGMVDSGEVPEAELKKANARQLGCTGYVLYLGLNKSVEELGIRDYTVFISDIADTAEQFRRMHSIEENDYLAVNCLNIPNPNCSPAGTSILYFTKLYMEDAWKNVRAEDYKKTKNAIAKETIAQYEKATGVKIADAIEEISIAAPPTFARYLGIPEGVFYGYLMDRTWDGTLARTMALEEERTIQGLRFCGGHLLSHGFTSSYMSGAMMGAKTVQDCKEGR
jgi:phytoene dehydrogenase-like protein